MLVLALQFSRGTTSTAELEVPRAEAARGAPERSCPRKKLPQNRREDRADRRFHRERQASIPMVSPTDTPVH